MSLHIATRPKIGLKWCARVALLKLAIHIVDIGDIVDIVEIVDNVDIVDIVDFVDIVDIVDFVDIAHTIYWCCCVNLKQESWWITRLCAISKTLVT